MVGFHEGKRVLISEKMILIFLKFPINFLQITYFFTNIA